MVASFVTCYGPYALTAQYYAYSQDENKDYRLVTIPAFFSKSSCVYNPLIYAFMNKQVKRRPPSLSLRHAERLDMNVFRASTGLCLSAFSLTAASWRWFSERRWRKRLRCPPRRRCPRPLKVWDKKQQTSDGHVTSHKNSQRSKTRRFAVNSQKTSDRHVNTVYTRPDCSLLCRRICLEKRQQKANKKWTLVCLSPFVIGEPVDPHQNLPGLCWVTGRFVRTFQVWWRKMKPPEPLWTR